MGAGVLECDVTFTKDRQLVCRHDQCDLHASTDILGRPQLAASAPSRSRRPIPPRGQTPRRCVAPAT
jgi:glycerophosphoryl diester phosphodiesterase